MAMMAEARPRGGEEPMAMADDGRSAHCATSAQDAVALSAEGRERTPKGGRGMLMRAGESGTGDLGDPGDVDV
jgi:hypothetical protein